MTNKSLGKLTSVELREVWESEAGNFTPWLAKDENLALLGENIGLDLELETQEKNVGPFRADILAKDTTNGNWVLIENQLEQTDHTHLGQLLTYAAGLKAVTIVLHDASKSFASAPGIRSLASRQQSTCQQHTVPHANPWNRLTT